MNVSKFEEDLGTLLDRLTRVGAAPVRPRLEQLKRKLVDLYVKNQINIYHSSLELLCARELLARGFEVDVEHRLSADLVCDVFGTKGDDKSIIEIETGYVPPEHALDPVTYTEARLASKIARYSSCADEFALACPVFVLLPLPPPLFRPARDRGKAEILELKALCDRYYSNPPVRLEQIVEGRLHAIYLVEVDTARTIKFEPTRYEQIVSATLGVS